MAQPAVAPDHWLRPAVPADVPAMADLINGYADQGLMLPKTRSDLFRSIRDYLVVVDLTGTVCACAGLRIYSGQSAEIVGLAVAGAWQGRGLGGLLVDRLVEEAERLAIHRVFAMTLSERFFARHGFGGIPRAFLPEKERADCAGCPRRPGCRETAVQRVLGAEAGPVVGAAGDGALEAPAGPRGRDLPVVALARG